MRRNKKIVVLANCLLNTNVKVYGISTVGGAAPIVTQLIEAGYGIIQLPCIEMAMFGSRRWGRVYEQCDFPSYRKKCRELLIPVVDQIKDLDSNGYEIKCVIGVDGSPTCGVNKTCYGDWGGEIGQSDEIEQSDNHRCRIEEGMGIMVEELKRLFSDYGLDIPFTAIDESDMSSSYDDLIL